MHWLGASACARSHSLPLPALALATFVRLRRLSDRRLHADFAEFGSPAQYSPAVTLRLLASIRYFRTFGMPPRHALVVGCGLSSSHKQVVGT